MVPPVCTLSNFLFVSPKGAQVLKALYQKNKTSGMKDITH